MRHVNIPIFIPHLGCPNQCVFCNQRAISGVQKFEAESVVGIIEDALKTIGENDEVEIAFFRRIVYRNRIISYDRIIKYRSLVRGERQGRFYKMLYASGLHK